MIYLSTTTEALLNSKEFDVEKAGGLSKEVIEEFFTTLDRMTSIPLRQMLQTQLVARKVEKKDEKRDSNASVTLSVDGTPVVLEVINHPVVLNVSNLDGSDGNFYDVVELAVKSKFVMNGEQYVSDGVFALNLTALVQALHGVIEAAKEKKAFSPDEAEKTESTAEDASNSEDAGSADD